MRPVESTSMVAVSLLGRAMAVPVVRLAHGSYVLVAVLYWTEYSSGELEYSRMWVRLPIVRTSACVSVREEMRTTGPHVRSLPSFQIQVPARDAAVLGATIHQ